MMTGPEKEALIVKLAKAAILPEWGLGEGKLDEALGKTLEDPVVQAGLGEVRVAEGLVAVINCVRAWEVGHAYGSGFISSLGKLGET